MLVFFFFFSLKTLQETDVCKVNSIVHYCTTISWSNHSIKRQIKKIDFTGSLSILRAMVLAKGSLILETSLGRNEGKVAAFG